MPLLEGSTTARNLDAAGALPRSTHFRLFATRKLDSEYGFDQVVVTIIADVDARSIHLRDFGVANQRLDS